MDGPESLVIRCDSTKEMIQATNKIIEQLPPPIRRHFRLGVDKYLARDFDNAYKYVNGKSVADILRESDRASGVIAAGEEDGLRYTLYEPEQNDDNDAAP